MTATAGIEVTTDPAFSCGSGGQAVTLQKGAGPTEIHVQRCDPDQRHVEFTTVLIDGCSGQIRTVYTWKWLEPTDAPVGISQQNDQQPNGETPGAPTTSSTSSSTCNAQSQNGGSNPPEALKPTGDTPIRGSWTGPNTSAVQQIVDAQKAHRKALDMLYKVRKGTATPEEAQEAADTLWLMSHEFRVTNISYDYAKTGRLKLFWDLLRHWVTDEGLEASEEVRTAGVPWAVYENRCGEVFSPKEAVERYGGPGEDGLGVWHQKTPISYIGPSPGGLDEVIFGPTKDHGEGKSGDKYVDPDGVWLTESEAYRKYGDIPLGTMTKAEWEESHGLQPLPPCPGAQNPEPAQQSDTASKEDPAPACNIDTSSQNQAEETASGTFKLEDGTLCIGGVPSSALHSPSPRISQLTDDANALYAPTHAAYEEWLKQWHRWLDDGMEPAERGEELLDAYDALESVRTCLRSF